MTPELVEEYFFASSTLPFAIFFARHKDLGIDRDAQRRFNDSARDVMFYSLKEALT